MKKNNPTIPLSKHKEKVNKLLEVIWEVAPKCCNVPLHSDWSVNIATYIEESATGTRYACDECIDVMQSKRDEATYTVSYHPCSSGLVAKQTIEKMKGELNE